LGEPERGTAEPQKRISFWCAHHHHSSRSFAYAAEIPLTWDCPHCGRTAGRDQANPPAAGRPPRTKSHLAYVRERRDVDAGEVLLQEALAKLRASMKPTG
jgi:hypothetical protein